MQIVMRFCPPRGLMRWRVCIWPGSRPRIRASRRFGRVFPARRRSCSNISETEILCDDTLRMAAHLRAEGAEVGPDAPHVWHLFDGWLPEARDALGQVGLFLRARLTPAERRRDES